MRRHQSDQCHPAQETDRDQEVGDGVHAWLLSHAETDLTDSPRSGPSPAPPSGSLGKRTGPPSRTAQCESRGHRIAQD